MRFQVFGLFGCFCEASWPASRGIWLYMNGGVSLIDKAPSGLFCCFLGVQLVSLCDLVHSVGSSCLACAFLNSYSWHE